LIQFKNFREAIKNKSLVKLWAPLAVLLTVSLSPMVGYVFHKCFGNDFYGFQSFMYFLPQYVFPYDGYVRQSVFMDGAHQSFHPFGLEGWAISTVHWAVVLLLYHWITRKCSLMESFLIFGILGLSSLLFLHYLLGSMGWVFRLEGL
jgi:hypothetical protein